ncbi:14684_t:CDS:2, partial [Gigaspora rosea]
LYLSSNPSSKNKDSQEQRDLAMYIDSTVASDTCIDTLANLGLTTTSCIIAWHKATISDEHAKTID